jgi:hypothetical protein
MALGSMQMPPQLKRLIDRLDELDNVWSPLIVPLIEVATILAVSSRFEDRGGGSLSHSDAQ